ncbi:MAG: SDR family oxidoreductase [Cyclobacteriaceae bacterium]
MEKVLIIGANGKTGRILTFKLKNHEQYIPVAMVRDEKQVPFFEKEGIETVIGDLEKDFDHAFEGIDKVIFAAGSGPKTGKEKTLAVDKKGAIKTIELGAKKGIKKYVMLSSRGAENAEKADESMQHYLLAKKEADEQLKKSGLNHAIVRPGRLTDGPFTGKIKVDAVLNEKGDISREDVAAVLIYMLDENIKGNQVFGILSGEVEIPAAIQLFLKSVQAVV